MQVKNLIVGTLLSTSAVAGCNAIIWTKENKQYLKQKELLEQMGATQNLNKTEQLLSLDEYYKTQCTGIQHTLDSVKFSELYTGEQQADKSKALTEYNEMIARTHLPLKKQFIPMKRETIVVLDKDTLNSNYDRQLTHNEMKKIHDANSIFEQQFILDSTLVRKKLKDPVMIERFEKICSEISPTKIK